MNATFEIPTPPPVTYHVHDDGFVYSTSSHEQICGSMLSSACMLENQQLVMGDAYEQLLCLLQQEEKNYKCPDYLASPSPKQSSSSSSSSPMLDDENNDSYGMTSMNVVEQCAKVVTDFSLQQQSPPACSSSKIVNKVPSAVCVQDLVAEADPTLIGRVSPSSSVTYGKPSSLIMNREVVGNWRQQMFDWSNLVVDTFGIDREIVSVAFNILDRYVAKESTTTTIPITREDFQLFSMTSLYIAVKTLESYPRKLSVDALVEMSRGFYTKDDIQVTERDILQGLDWYVNPPTCHTFSNLYWRALSPLPPTTPKVKATWKVMMELATSDTWFLSKRASSIGLAAVIFAAKSEGVTGSVIDNLIAAVSSISSDQDEWNQCYTRFEVLCTM